MMRYVLAAVLVAAAALLYPATASGAAAPDGVLWMGPQPPSLAAANGIGRVGRLGDERILRVPAYLWRDGCSPTAAGMLIAYWDRRFPRLAPGDVQDPESLAAGQLVASHRIGTGPRRHFEDYAFPIDDWPVKPDRSEPPVGDEHADDSLADFLGTSRSALDLAYGWTWGENIAPGIVRWGKMRGFIVLTEPVAYGQADAWERFRAEIDAGRPVLMTVDASGDGVCDHSIIGVGYRDTTAGRSYGCHNTWTDETRFYEWRPPTRNADMGVGMFEVFVVRGPRNLRPHHAKAWPKKALLPPAEAVTNPSVTIGSRANGLLTNPSFASADGQRSVPAAARAALQQTRAAGPFATTEPDMDRVFLFAAVAMIILIAFFYDPRL